MLKLLLKHSRKTLINLIGVLGISSAIALPAFSQQNPPNSSPSININRNATIRNPRLTGGNRTYPQGSRINGNGIISTPRGQRTVPSVSIKHGDGSTSYYYRDGSRITIDATTVPATGKPLR